MNGIREEAEEAEEAERLEKARRREMLMRGVQYRCGGKADWGRTVLKLLLTEGSVGDTSKVI